MKHKIKSDGFMRAWCERPGCITGAEGRSVETMTKKDFERLFDGNCPYTVDLDKNHEMKEYSGKVAIKHIINDCKKQIKQLEKTIAYYDHIRV